MHRLLLANPWSVSNQVLGRSCWVSLCVFSSADSCFLERGGSPICYYTITESFCALLMWWGLFILLMHLFKDGSIVETQEFLLLSGSPLKYLCIFVHVKWNKTTLLRYVAMLVFLNSNIFWAVYLMMCVVTRWMHRFDRVTLLLCPTKQFCYFVWQILPFSFFWEFLLLLLQYQHHCQEHGLKRTTSPCDLTEIVLLLYVEKYSALVVTNESFEFLLLNSFFQWRKKMRKCLSPWGWTFTFSRAQHSLN